MTLDKDISIDISQLCNLLFQQNQKQEAMLEGMLGEDRAKWSAQRGDRATLFDNATGWLARKTGQTLGQILTYCHRAANGGHWGKWKRGTNTDPEIWPDITETAKCMADFGRHGGITELIAYCWGEYPEESEAMGLPKSIEKNSTSTGAQKAPLDEEDLMILQYLAEQSITRLQVDIAAAIERDEKTIRKRLDYLRNEGLIERPRGKRKGEIITPEGLKRLETL